MHQQTSRADATAVQCDAQEGSLRVTKLGRDLVVGDVLLGFGCGNGRRVTRFVDYPAGSLLHEAQGGLLPHGTRIAYSGGSRWSGDDGWGVTVTPLCACEVVR